ncbi:MAG: CvpA family protein, partial [Rhizobiales bacterium]|nr:CvpA family protein [Hyphomicrobiales bacterium]
DAPFTILDVALFFIVIISGLLAMTRGFLREFFSIVAWVAAALAVMVFYPILEEDALKLITHDKIAQAALAASLFIGTLIIVSIVSYMITDKLLASKIGALDRTLGFIFGGLRGFLLVVACYLGLLLIMPNESSHSTEISSARSIGMIKNSSDILLSVIPTKSENPVAQFIQSIKDTRSKNSAASGADETVGFSDDVSNKLPQVIEQVTAGQ